MALESGLANPVAGLYVIVLYALTDGVEVTELELSLCIAMIGGLAIPPGSLRVAEWYALATVIEAR